jgi:hypothetical protein
VLVVGSPSGIPLSLGLNGSRVQHSGAFLQIGGQPEETDRYWNAIIRNGGTEIGAVGAGTAGISGK